MKADEANHEQRSDAPLSVLAVVALVCAAIPCCPVVNLAGVVLATIALRRIDRLAGALRGRRLARIAFAVGIGLGLLSTVAWLQLAVAQQSRYERQVAEALQQVLLAAADGDAAAAVTLWAGGDAPSIEAIEEFGAAVVERYGRPQRVDVASMHMTGGPLSTEVEVAILFVFERERTTGSARLATVVEPGRLTPAFRVRALVIDDPTGGDLSLPPPDDR